MTLLQRLVGLRDHLSKNMDIAREWIPNDYVRGEPCMVLVKASSGEFYHGEMHTHEFNEVSIAINGENEVYRYGALSSLKLDGPELLLEKLDKAIARQQEFELKNDPEEPPTEDPTPPSEEEEPVGELIEA